MIYYGAAKLPLKQFFLVTGVVVVILAAGLLANALSNLHAAAIIDDLGSRPWDTESTISMTSTMGKFLHTVLGYDSAPAMAQIVLYWSYVIVVLGAYFVVPAGRPPAIRRVEPLTEQPGEVAART